MDHDEQNATPPRKKLVDFGGFMESVKEATDREIAEMEAREKEDAEE